MTTDEFLSLFASTLQLLLSPTDLVYLSILLKTGHFDLSRVLCFWVLISGFKGQLITDLEKLIGMELVTYHMTIHDKNGTI